MAADELVNEASDRSNKSKLQKIIETGAIVLSWVVMGMYAEISGPTLIDLKYRLNTGYEELAAAISTGGIGTFPGCIIGGFLVDKISGYSHLILALAMDTAAVMIVLIPWAPNMQCLSVLCFFIGFVIPIHNAVGTRINLDIWKSESASPIILMHLGYGIGSFLTPLYSDPFLGVEVQHGNETEITNTDISGTVMPTNTSVSPEKQLVLQNSRIEYAYAITGIAAASLSIVFFGFQLKGNKIIKQINDTNTAIRAEEDSDHGRVNNYSEEQSKLKHGRKADICNKCKDMLQMINPVPRTKWGFWYGSSILLFMFVFFGNAGGSQGLISKFLRSYSIDQLNFSKSDASLLNTSFWISFSLGRLLFSIIARWMSVRVIIVLETSMFMCSAILIAMFANESSIALWILVQPVAFFLGPMWPTGVVWTDYHIKLTGMGIVFLILGSSIGFICHIRLIGYLYDNIGAHTFVYLVASTGIFGFIIALALDVIGAKHGNRFALETPENNIEQVDNIKDEDACRRETNIKF